MLFSVKRGWYISKDKSEEFGAKAELSEDNVNQVFSLCLRKMKFSALFVVP
jgi:hypothetical protein